MSTTTQVGIVVLACAAGGACGGQVILPTGSSTVSPGSGGGATAGTTVTGTTVPGNTGASGGSGGATTTVVDAGGCDPSAAPPVLSGGTLDSLDFAITGSTRPPIMDDTAAYPTSIIQKIWQDVEARSPRPAFAVLTGNYLFASPMGVQAGPQLDLYLGARAAFSNPVFPALGDQECDGALSSNCPPGTMSADYAAFMAKMIAPLGTCTPFYEVDVASTGNTWSAKVVVIAANAWTPTQATWLDAAMSKPTTYTFVVRHEAASQITAPGVPPSEAILANHAYTLLFNGAAKTFAYDPTTRQVTVGNGGAPLNGSLDYGYAIAAQRADGAIAVQALDYATNAMVQTFAVKADGTPTP